MREIKFRVWDKKRATMYYGDIRQFNSLAPFCNAPEKFPIMQYTGLKDKNGKEIYEGDIVCYKLFINEYPAIGEIKYSDNAASFYLETSTVENSKLICSRDLVEVVGNIYENPEMINASKSN